MFSHILVALLYSTQYIGSCTVILDDFQAEFELEVLSIYENTTLPVKEKVLNLGEVINDFQFNLVNPSAGEQGLPIFLTFSSTDYNKPVDLRIKEMSEAFLAFPGAEITGQENALQEAETIAMSMNEILVLVEEYLNLE